MPELARPYRRRQAPSRSSRPCDGCRRRKTRCVVEPGQSKCGVCSHKQQACTFEKEPPRRLTPGLNEYVGPKQADSNVHESPSPQEVLSSGLEAAHDVVETMHEPDADAYSAKCDMSLGLNPTKFAELYGLGSDMEPILMRHRPYDPSNNEYSLPTHAIRLVASEDQGIDYPVTFHMVTDRTLEHTALVDTIETCVNPHGERLVRLFWKMVHPTFPIIHKQSFMESYTDSYRRIDAPLLGSVYLIALNWWHYDPYLSNQPDIDVPALRTIVLQSIHSSYHHPRLSSIEAILLYLQCKPEDPLNPDHTFARGLTAQALAVGEALGLHLDASSWAIPSWERSLRKRLSWALYMQDVWTSLIHGRPIHVAEDNWSVNDLTKDDLDLDSTSDGESCFTQIFDLTKVLYKVLKKFYSLRGSVLQDTVQLFSDAQPIWEYLETWHESLPPALGMQCRLPRQLCANGNIYLAYFAVKINILRRLVRSTALAPLCVNVSILNTIRQRAHNTAQQAMDLVASLRLENLEAFWYFSAPYYFSVIGSFCVLLLVTSLTPAERDHWRESLRSYLWTLRVGCKSNEPMRYAVNRLEGAILRGLEHALAVTVDATSPAAPEATPTLFDAADGFGFPFEGTDGFDMSAIDLNAFDFLSGTAVMDP